MAMMRYAEPFSNWLEEKIELPIFEELPAPECGQNKPIVYAGAPKTHVQQETTQTLLQEFESVLGDVEACHQIFPPVNSALTPPQSPPPSPPNKINGIDTQLLVTLQPVLQTPLYPCPRIIQQQQQQQQQTIVETPQTNASSYLGQISGEWNAENVSLVPLRDVASELAAVDEYVRSCAEEIAPSSPCTSSGASYFSSEDSSSPDDPDWTGESSGSSYTKQRTSRLTKNRHKPYSRPSVEDKKVRKKEQNKNAATRYRQKKKQEIKEIVGEEQELVDHNVKLKDQVKELNREIGYLKGLMRDLFKAKGLMK
ncbi:activating transcription factor of chaperone isoform X2 [Venturia canescens]|uniref:activating transcription factor of chaperone isoform X2 n=1 Tax=Venturia canescens TaxID=32260 RepID=UPI001C9C8B7C|nr:activating transcription factor of chaperone isoform X2 [Venturia canescens]